jgi:hypothetical protein
MQEPGPDPPMTGSKYSAGRNFLQFCRLSGSSAWQNDSLVRLGIHNAMGKPHCNKNRHLLLSRHLSTYLEVYSGASTWLNVAIQVPRRSGVMSKINVLCSIEGSGMYDCQPYYRHHRFTCFRNCQRVAATTQQPIIRTGICGPSTTSPPSRQSH